MSQNCQVASAPISHFPKVNLGHNVPGATLPFLRVSFLSTLRAQDNPLGDLMAIDRGAHGGYSLFKIPPSEVLLKPKIYFKCRNMDCSNYNIEIEKDPEKSLFLESCEKCYDRGWIRIKYKDTEEDSIDRFVLTMTKMGQEYSLLKRIVDGKIGNKEDEKRMAEIKAFLEDLECPTCGQKFLKEE